MLHYKPLSLIQIQCRLTPDGAVHPANSSLRCETVAAPPPGFLNSGQSCTQDSEGISDENAQTHEIYRERSDLCRRRGLGSFRQAQPDPPQPRLYAEVVGQAAAEIVGEDEALRWAGRARPIRCAPAASPKSARRSSTARRRSTCSTTSGPGEIKAQVIERDGKILMVKDCPIHGHFEDVMAIDTAFFKHLEDVFPGPRHPRAQRRHAAQARLQHHHPRPRLGADHRPDQPLQHDVRPVLHGRQPGGLRARAELGRHQDAAR